MNSPAVEENMHATIRIHILKASIEIDVPFNSKRPFTSDVGGETTMISEIVIEK